MLKALLDRGEQARGAAPGEGQRAEQAPEDRQHAAGPVGSRVGDRVEGPDPLDPLARRARPGLNLHSASGNECS